jgi:hypothetical protein
MRDLILFRSACQATTWKSSRAELDEFFFLLGDDPAGTMPAKGLPVPLDLPSQPSAVCTFVLPWLPRSR